MKPRKIFVQLFTPYLLIALTGLIILILITRFTFSEFYFNETKIHLVEKARLIEREISKLLLNGDSRELNYTVSKYSKLAQNRITVILPSGEVVADSSFDFKNMENHFSRSEIKVALDGEVGNASRYSPTLNKNFLYVAIALKEGDEIIGVLRNAVTISGLEQSLASLTKNTFIWSFVLLIFLAYLIYLQAKKISAPLEKMKQEVESFDLESISSGLKLSDSSIVEISALSRSFQNMQQNLTTQFKKISKQKNEQLAVFASMMEGVVTITPELKIYHCNRAALELFNYQEDYEARGVDFSKFIKSTEILTLAKDILKHGGSFTEEISLDDEVILDVHGSELEEFEPGTKGVVLVFNDITKMRALEKHRTEFVANVSHELKTPLTAIQGYLETLQGDVLDDKEVVQKFIAIIARHSKRLITIVEDLLSLSSIEREDVGSVIEKELYSVQKLLRSVSVLASEKAFKKNINIVLSDDEVDITCPMNIALLEQAVLNLLHNAISYSSENSKVLLGFKKTSSKHVAISVTDCGVGISKEHHDRLFERFYSVDKARSRELGGSGLGLSIVKHIALCHNGDVRVESSVGAGSTFTIILPCKLD